MKKILVINAHPNKKSYCSVIAKEYYKGGKNSKYNIKKIIIGDLKFDPILHKSNGKDQSLEKDLIKAQKMIKWCDHLVLVTPVWWGSLPALTKGFFDRILIGGFSHKFCPLKKRIVKLLTKRSAHIIYTQGQSFIHSRSRGDLFWKNIRRYIFDFCGFRPIKRTYLDKIKSRTDKNLKVFLGKIYKMGKQGL